MMGSQQSFGDFNNMSFYGGTKQSDKKGYAMVSLEGTAPAAAGKPPAVPGFLGNILGGAKPAEPNPSSLPQTSGSGLWGSLDRLPSDATKTTTRAGEQNGLLQSGLSAVKDGASRVLESANNVVNVTRASISDNPLASQNLLMFGVVAGVGVLFMCLAFLTLPLLVFAPSKFALLFTMGSLCFLAALGLLRGIGPLSKHLIAPTRLPFTVVYFSSLFLTLYATLLAKSYVLTLVFSLLQLCGLASFLVSYIPGGTQMLKFVGQMVWQLLRKACQCKDSRELPLPL